MRFSENSDIICNGVLNTKSITFLDDTIVSLFF